MSFFLIYFESKNSTSSNYRKFSAVGNFQVPKNIFAGKIDGTCCGLKFSGAIISDYSGQSANNFFLKNGNILRTELISFIEQRLDNECIISNLFGFMFNGEDNFAVAGDLLTIDIKSLPKLFNYSLFSNGRGVKILGS